MNLIKVGSSNPKKHHSMRQSIDLKLNTLAGKPAMTANKVNIAESPKDKKKIQKVKAKAKVPNPISSLRLNDLKSEQIQGNCEHPVRQTSEGKQNKISNSHRANYAMSFALNCKTPKNAKTNLSSPGSKNNLLTKAKLKGIENKKCEGVIPRKTAFPRKPTYSHPELRTKILGQTSISEDAVDMTKKSVFDSSDGFKFTQKNFNKYNDKEVIMESDSKDFVEDLGVKVDTEVPITNLISNYNQFFKTPALKKILPSRKEECKEKQKHKQSFSLTKCATVSKNSPRQTPKRYPLTSKNMIHKLAYITNIETFFETERNDFTGFPKPNSK